MKVEHRTFFLIRYGERKTGKEQRHTVCVTMVAILIMKLKSSIRLQFITMQTLASSWSSRITRECDPRCAESREHIGEDESQILAPKNMGLFLLIA